MRLSSWHLPLDHLSASSLADAITCPERWRRERILGEWGKQNLDGFIGSVHHRAVEWVLRRKQDGLETNTLAELEPLYMHCWWDQTSQEGEPEWTEKPEKVQDKGKGMLLSAVGGIVPQVEPTGVEAWFEERVPGVPVPIQGRIDTTTTEAIWEFKTTKQKQSKPKSKWRFQGRIYQLVERKPVHWGITTKQATPVSYSPAHADTPGLVLPLVNPDVTVTMILNAIAYLDDLYVRYGPGETWPMTGIMGDWYCDYCPFGPKNPNPSCPAWRE